MKFLWISFFLLLCFHGISQEDKIVFSSNRNGTYHLFTIKPDGSHLQQITDGKANDRWPKWSPDGQQIIFTSDRAGKQQIFLMNSDGSKIQNLSNNAFKELDPVISPDGKKIAFSSNASGSYQLYTMDLDGTNRKQLTDYTPFCGRPDWSPDASKLVYLSMENGYYEVYKINADGSQKKKLTNLKSEAGAPSWSKNGYHILFHAHEEELDQLFRINPDGSGLIKLSEGSHADFLARWNGQSNKILFTSMRDGEYHLYTGNLITGKETQITNSSSKDYMADWYSPRLISPPPVKFTPKIPENFHLAFVSYRGGTADIFTSKADGSHIQRKTDTDKSNSFPKDAGDGKHLIYLKGEAESGSQQIPVKLNLETGKEYLIENQPIVKGAMEEMPSPDSMFTAYSKKENGYWEIFLFDKQKDTHLKITDNQTELLPAQIKKAFWSPDGKKIALLNGKDYYNLYLKVYDIDSHQTSTITQRGYMFSGVVWLKSNLQFIINIKIKNKNTYELWSIHLDGTGLKQLTNNPKRGNLHPTISPDGNWIAFESARDGDDGEIYLMRPDGTQQTRITYHPSYEGRPAWIILKNREK